MKPRKFCISLLVLGFASVAYSAHAQTITNGVFVGDLSLQPKTTAPTQPGNFHVSGSLVDFGTALVGATPYPGILFTYTDDTTGNTSKLTLDSYRSALSWNWRQGSGANQKVKMTLDNNNKLSLYDLSGVSKITLDPIAGQITVNGQTLLAPNTSGQVGIGTLTPDSLLHVVSSSVSIPTTLKVQNFAGVTNSAAEVLLGTSTGLNVNNVGASLYAKRTNAISNGDTDLLLKTSAGTTLSTKLAIKASGNIGIGTTTPTEKLEVVGNIKASGVITCAPGGDIPMYSGN